MLLLRLMDVPEACHEVRESLFSPVGQFVLREVGTSYACTLLVNISRNNYEYLTMSCELNYNCRTIETKKWERNLRSTLPTEDGHKSDIFRSKSRLLLGGTSCVQHRQFQLEQE